MCVCGCVRVCSVVCVCNISVITINFGLCRPPKNCSREINLATRGLNGFMWHLFRILTPSLSHLLAINAGIHFMRSQSVSLSVRQLSVSLSVSLAFWIPSKFKLKNNQRRSRSHTCVLTRTQITLRI